MGKAFQFYSSYQLFRVRPPLTNKVNLTTKYFIDRGKKGVYQSHTRKLVQLLFNIKLTVYNSWLVLRHNEDMEVWKT